ncbi:hypothetical protein COCC4DRAFT_31825 [Bipolaris maydis ATCC 48331]|uniref:Diphthamide biosynthesis protein 4 n=2 Tax=Cochliobolus heterostrophus TaxID=5016 RepID=M2TWR0_COCH5|nr:uncharacterized protein COCC4DRAFT_31825 [Bipolaris maydis ATCC 48331]EMD90954.1 hypothetical protein COCHEDRAFT_1021734 [Bipolaris maydis C5]KAH7560089.1 hypothetical protein BM1_03723 [Bipolaris maydis]ENI05962.1 hypothetical protein COCC4DRAFT_31825 [Bipolaris maydis ATCC 48331]KAJ5022688.1 hypothetical protein J3E73DRAFT_341584 [Bipolaris maydis]KAJ5064637.1 diphthamide biosynthesis protein 4 [Bipolaris maydis]
MAYTKDYYHILSLDAPGWRQPANQANKTAADLRRAYKIALLAAHPDKKKQNGIAPMTTKTKPTYTVDDVKEAYTILADPKTRAEYDTWFLHNRHTLRSSTTTTNMATSAQEQALASSEDFILGLELVDLSDFDQVEPMTKTTSTSENGVEWMRACRCGDEKGFRIVEDDLEDAQVRGENEVLVGCQGCSLWLRVGFEVEEG